MIQAIRASALIVAAVSGFTVPLTAADHAADAWKVCTETAARNYALTSSVPASAVVEAALGACADKYQTGGSTPRAGDRQPATDDASRNAAYKATVDLWRPQLVEGVLKIRKADQLRQ